MKRPGQPRRTVGLPRGKSASPSRSSLPARSSGIQRKTRVRKRNAKRRQTEFQRTYHSKARVVFVKNLPCVVCGLGPCDNAHIETGGMGRKADYTQIVPLCCMPMDHPWSSGYPIGHHGLFHQLGRKAFEHYYRRLNLGALAVETERKWQAFSSLTSKAGQP